MISSSSSSSSSVSLNSAFCLRVAALPLALAAAFPASSFAQSTLTPQLQETVVTATRSAKPVGDVVADVTIIDRETIERAGAVGLADVLARVPGFEITRNGGIANSGGVFIRGGESRHTAVLIDGVRVDSQSTSGGANLGAIPLSQIDRIEIVRGPTSAVYGSDAVAGVIQIFTKKGEGAFSPSVTFGLASDNTKKLDLYASGSAGVDSAFDYSVGLSQAKSEGFSVRRGYNPDKDGYDVLAGNARLGFQVNPGHRVEATLLHSRTEAKYDTTPITNRNPNVARINTLESLGANWQAKWTDRYSTKLSVSQSKDRGEEAVGGALDETNISSVLFQNEYRLGAHQFSALLEHRTDDFLLTSGTRVDRNKSQDGVGLGYGWSQDAHTVQLNLRRDRDSEFGGKTTGSAAYAFAITPAWKVSASAGTSYRVPTLYQRFSQYGVAGLKPETGRNVEAALKYAQGTSEYSATVYRNKLTNLLTFLSGAPAAVCPSASIGCYANTARAQYDGVTFAGSERLGQFRVYGSLDVQDPRDKTTNRTLPRRARQHAVLGADTSVAGWTVAGDVLTSGTRFDSATSQLVLPGYTLVNLSASTAISREWKLVTKLDNLTDKVYETAGTYVTPRRTLYVGLTWAPF
ncbi:MAG: TonB-dependent receptor [Comamonadaceae bacterium]|nr:MAG: TonB-dependent receptor [Comamonadaceae bacterium]